MSTLTVPRDRLPAAVPPITTGLSLIALVPVTGDANWAAETAWSVARAAATGGRQVMLVDLGFDDPVLHRHVGDTLENGIVDAFEYGVSLNFVTRPHLNGTLFFVPRGSEVGDPTRMLESPRWTKLAKGLESQGALLLVYLTPSSLLRLGARCDGAIVLAPNGFVSEATPIPALDQAVERGVPLLAVISSAAEPDEGPVASAAPPRGVPRQHPRSSTALAAEAVRPRRRIGRWVAGAVAITAGAVLARAVLRGGEDSATPVATDTTAVAAVPAPVESASTPPPPAPEPVRAPPAEPFATARPFVVQVAAYDAVEPARARASRLAGPDRTVFVTPLALGGMGVWHRVYVGPFVSERGAVDARGGLWTARVVRRNEGIVRRAPFALEVPLDQRQAVEQAGLVPYVLEQRLLVGAFEFPEQTAIAAEMLTGAGIPFTLVDRTESRP